MCVLLLLLFYFFNIIQACDIGHYGEQCTNECKARNCHGNEMCTKETGQCVDGCEPGWQGTACTIREYNFVILHYSTLHKTTVHTKPPVTLGNAIFICK